MNTSLSISKDQLRHYLSIARKNAVFVFILFLILIYGFLGWRITELTKAEPSDADVAAGLKTIGVPKVDEEVVKKMEQLEDNSVSVNGLFKDARGNPFQE
jgi:predicted negative regulator of RcsB-dependent stress response